MTDMIPEIAALAKEYSMSQCAAIALQRPLTIDFYKTWLDQKHHATMQYLEDHFELKEKPEKLLPAAKAALVFTKAYFPHPRPLQDEAKNSVTRKALYAQGEDYHHWFKDELITIAKKLKHSFPEAEFVAMTDSSPVLERDLAHRAGLGWFGKNSCLIHPQKGSLFFIGEIYSTMPASNFFANNNPSEFKPNPLPDLCGKCTRCIDICPTKALIEPKVLDANKCISFLTIEAKTIPPEELRAQMGDWFFGCDLCQTVCPWNEKIFKHQLEKNLLLPEESSTRTQLISELEEILTLSGKQLQKKFAGTALSRAGAFGLRRNAIVVATNRGLVELLPAILALKPDLRLADLVQWSSSHLETLIV